MTLNVIANQLAHDDLRNDFKRLSQLLESTPGAFGELNEEELNQTEQLYFEKFRALKDARVRTQEEHDKIQILDPAHILVPINAKNNALNLAKREHLAHYIATIDERLNALYDVFSEINTWRETLANPNPGMMPTPPTLPKLSDFNVPVLSPMPEIVNSILGPTALRDSAQDIEDRTLKTALLNISEKLERSPEATDLEKLRASLYERLKESTVRYLLSHEETEHYEALWKRVGKAQDQRDILEASKAITHFLEAIDPKRQAQNEAAPSVEPPEPEREPSLIASASIASLLENTKTVGRVLVPYQAKLTQKFDPRSLVLAQLVKEEQRTLRVYQDVGAFIERLGHDFVRMGKNPPEANQKALTILEARHAIINTQREALRALRERCEHGESLPEIKRELAQLVIDTRAQRQFWQSFDQDIHEGGETLVWDQPEREQALHTLEALQDSLERRRLNRENFAWKAASAVLETPASKEDHAPQPTRERAAQASFTTNAPAAPELPYSIASLIAFKKANEASSVPERVSANDIAPSAPPASKTLETTSQQVKNPKLREKLAHLAQQLTKKAKA